MMKLEKSKEDKAAENKRNELLKFLNASYDWHFVQSGGNAGWTSWNFLDATA
jgi:hypothetical protein